MSAAGLPRSPLSCPSIAGRTSGSCPCWKSWFLRWPVPAPPQATGGGSQSSVARRPSRGESSNRRECHRRPRAWLCMQATSVRYVVAVLSWVQVRGGRSASTSTVRSIFSAGSDLDQVVLEGEQRCACPGVHGDLSIQIDDVGVHGGR